MSVLQFGPKSFFRSRIYSIAREGITVGEISFGKRWESATITIGATNYTAAREGKIRGSFYLEASGNCLAKADQPSARSRAFTMQVGGRTLTLKALSVFGRTFILTEHDMQIGSIAALGWFAGKCKAELPDDVALEIQAFLIWLVIVMQRRALMQTVLISGVVAGT